MQPGSTPALPHVGAVTIIPPDAFSSATAKEAIATFIATSFKPNDVSSIASNIALALRLTCNFPGKYPSAFKPLS